MNRRGADNLSTKDKMASPSMSFFQRFHSIKSKIWSYIAIRYPEVSFSRYKIILLISLTCVAILCLRLLLILVYGEKALSEPSSAYSNSNIDFGLRTIPTSLIILGCLNWLRMDTYTIQDNHYIYMYTLKQ